MLQRVIQDIKNGTLVHKKHFKFLGDQLFLFIESLILVVFLHEIDNVFCDDLHLLLELFFDCQKLIEFYPAIHGISVLIK
jgi:hypothetical protein